MDIINSIISAVVGMIDTVLPIFSPSQEFVDNLDAAITWYIDINYKAAYLIPMEAVVICLTVIFLYYAFYFGIRIGKWIIATVRG
jgi:hypothetical protein